MPPISDYSSLAIKIQQRLGSVSMPTGGLVSVGLPITELPPPNLPDPADSRCFWARPGRDQWWLGLGCTWQAEQRGDAHLSAIAAQADKLWERLDVSGCSEPVRLSVWSEGRFSRLTLPTVQFICRDGVSYVIVSPDPAAPEAWRHELQRGLVAFGSIPEPSPGAPQMTRHGQEPDTQAWLVSAERAIGDIRSGRLSKLVLSRQVEYRASRELSPGRLVRSLIYRHPHCTIFAVDTADGCWVGASPEVLLERRGDRLFCEAVAGTVRRDPNETVDRELGEWLLRDAKSRREQGLVVEGLRQALQPFCHELSVDDRPRLMRLRGLQHLYTPIEGGLKEARRTLEIADRLHPSAAVCGSPRRAAAVWLDRHEAVERKGYSGLTGWLDGGGNASLSVVLRCLVLNGSVAGLYAGAGLVADSNSLAEWEETELKLANMIEALQDA